MEPAVVENNSEEQTPDYPNEKVSCKSEKINVEDKTFHSFREEDDAGYGIEQSDEETQIDPLKEQTDIPDLYRFLHAIEQGNDNDLDTDREPQSLFNRPEHVGKYSKISSLKYRVQSSTVQQYVKDFDTHIKDDVLMIANVSLEEIQEEEKKLRDTYVALRKQEVQQQKQKRLKIYKYGDVTKKRNAQDAKEKRRQLEKLVEMARLRQKLQVDLLHRSFERAEGQLQAVLKGRKADVNRMYGSLDIADDDLGGTKGKRWKVDWDQARQPIQIKLKALRGVRDKLPRGSYVMVVSLYNRLGGHVIRWCDEKGKEWGGDTLSISHDGNFYNSEIKIDQNLYTVLPSKLSIRPGMIVTFELYILRGSVVNTDRVVAWGCFPLCDGSFEVIEGKYKAPMMRGEMDFRLDKHSQIEKVISSDLDHWLCNIYFEIVKLPRYMDSQKEYEVELQFSSALINHPDRINLDGEEYKDSENPVFGSLVTMTTNNADSVSDITSLAQTSKTISMASLPQLDGEGQEQLNRKPHFLAKTNQETLQSTTALASHGDFGKNAKLEDSTDSEASVDEDEMFTVKKGPEEFNPVPGNIGLYSKRHLNNPVDVYTKKLYSVLPKSNNNSKRKQKKNLSYAEELEQHTASVKAPFSEKGRLAEKGWQRVSYTARMFLAELGLSEWRSREFWSMLILFIFTFFLRFYLHYCGQYLFLQALNIPVNSFNFLPYTVRLNYQSSLLHVMEEVSVVIIGPATVFVLFVLSVILCWISQKAAGMFPDIGCKFILMFGIQSIFDPIFIMIVDAAQGSYDYNNIPTSMPLADFAKLYWNFMQSQGSGIGGIFITSFLYLFLMFASASILYMYFLRLHNNGRMLDIYWRLHGKAEQMFVPYDLEVSLQELEYILMRAEQWRGEDGERRKVAVYEYIWEEEENDFMVFDESLETRPKSKVKKEKTTHIAIHTLHLDGLRELYRQFLALPDGAIVEVFGEMSYVPGLTKEIKKAINQEAKKVENLLDVGSTTSLKKGLNTPVTASTLTDGNPLTPTTSGIIKPNTIEPNPSQQNKKKQE